MTRNEAKKLLSICETNTLLYYGDENFDGGEIEMSCDTDNNIVASFTDRNEKVEAIELKFDNVMVLVPMSVNEYENRPDELK